MNALFFIIQGLVFLLIAIWIDARLQIKFKGKDLRPDTLQREQLDEEQDVQDHYTNVRETWEDENMLI